MCYNGYSDIRQGDMSPLRQTNAAARYAGNICKKSSGFLQLLQNREHHNDSASA